MVIVNYGNVKGYMDNFLKLNLDVYDKLVHKDRDLVFITAGDEREGKSVKMNKILKYLDPTYDLDRCCFDGESFVNKIKETTKPYKAIGWDEAQEFTSRSSISRFNRMMVKALSLIGSKNLYLGICIPSFFELDKYPAIHRSHFLMRVYSVQGNRGRFEFWNKERKKTLYLKGKKVYDYNSVKRNFIGRFTVEGFPFDDKEYRKKKMDAMEKGLIFDKPMESKWKGQRDIMIEYLHEECKLSMGKIAKIISVPGFEIGAPNIHKILSDRRINRGM